MKKTPLAPPSTGGSGALFEKLEADRTGISMEYPIDSDHPLSRLLAFGWATGGVAIGDVNNDGKADLFFAGTSVPNRLYIQHEDFQFLDVTARAGVAAPDTWCAGASMADVDNDGDLDIYVTAYQGPNLLYINESGRSGITFKEDAKRYGLDLSDGCLNAAFGDYDRDGNLDLYLQTYHLEPEKGRPEEDLEIKIQENIPLLPDEWIDYFVPFRKSKNQFSWTEAGRPDYFFRNNGLGTFTDITEKTGLALGRSYGTSVSWWDADHNGWPDLYVANDRQDPDSLYRNLANRQFSNSTSSVLPHTAWFARGTAIADFNNDLLIDMVATDSGPASHAQRLAAGIPSVADSARMLNSGGILQVRRNTLMINTGAARFVDAARMAGLDRTGAAWSVKAADFDNDGLTDIFMATGSTRDWLKADPETIEGDALIGKTRWDQLAGVPERREPDAAFRNLGDLGFENATSAWGLGGETMSYASGIGDLDGDGDLDLVVCRAGEPVGIYRNHSTGNRVSLRLVGRKSSTWGVGAEIMISAGGKNQLRQFWPTGGFMGSDEPVIHFGIGDAEKIDRLTIRWPTAAVETLTDVEANHFYEITEAITVGVVPLERVRRTLPLFAGNTAFLGAGHNEIPLDRNNSQPMIPRALAQLGPPMAWSDLDGDGTDELYLGGSRNQRGRLITQSPSLVGKVQPFTLDTISEDAGAVFFDADNDGDLDLYVASGGVEAGPGDAAFRDRLYRFENRKFNRTLGKGLPTVTDSSGPVAAADFDRDGDVDLFVGARSTPGAFPASPENRLLINDGNGTFSLDSAAAPGLKSSGMVASALWTDIDNDGWLDLMTAHDWGPIRIWKNVDGQLAEITGQAGTENLIGRWNGLAGGDLDNDGDIDYIATNIGLNTVSADGIRFGKHSGISEPMLVQTVIDLDGIELPLFGFSAWKSVLPEIGEKFESAREFAAAGLDNLFPPSLQREELSLSVNTRETGLLINNGAGAFTFQPLPRIAQIAPAFGAVMTDVNFDGRTDCYLVHNLDPPGTAIEAASGGLSQLFLGTGDPERLLQPVTTDESGLVVYGAARSVAVVDINEDDKADFAIGINNADPAVYLNQIPEGDHQPFTVRAVRKGKHSAGARITVKCPDMPVQTSEYHAGSGHFSQSPPRFFFGAPAKPDGPAVVTIRWSDGEETSQKIYFE